MQQYRFTTQDHPEAAGRVPRYGERSYEIKFVTDDGAELMVRCGEVSWDRLCEAVSKFLVEHAE